MMYSFATSGFVAGGGENELCRAFDTPGGLRTQTSTDHLNKDLDLPAGPCRAVRDRGLGDDQ
jgi:hypothetical protein